MDARVGVLFVLLLGTGWGCSARLIVHQISTESSVVPETLEYHEQDNDVQPMQNDQVCTLCEEFASQALDYLAENKTQNEVLKTLHATCSRVPTFKEECITLVDYYAPLFFLEISSIQPEAFCRKVNLCQEMAMLSAEIREDSCGLCERTVSEVLVKLKNPDTQLDIIEVLLKGCNSMDKYAQKCKKLVFEYGPAFLANAEQFLEKTDVCTMLHACDHASIALRSDS
ncbi:hypothetical protein K2173_000037 [Erythroxylum novogranatense]|uniref:Pulmonary surfactant-associated protein B n=1 Tax=Erythroxylum novogranatense TaxID=1862640 RepID=A0AAV8SP93_9ROSI|nr:hypothetical protein K2173_000037 [Erythroxylum novogranatense]